MELRQRREEGFDYVAVSPGNYGLDFMKQKYGYDLDRSVKCGNFIGAAIDMAAELGFRKMLLTGHIGKLIKVAGGIMNTHSKEADCRMEVMGEAAKRVCYYMENRAGNKLKADCILYANAFGELAKSEGAEKWFTLLERERALRT